MNVLHLHITDADSFPFEVAAYPDLNTKAAFSPDMTYTREDMATIVDHAASLGIEVIPEIDTPGHINSIGALEEL